MVIGIGDFRGVHNCSAEGVVIGGRLFFVGLHAVVGVILLADVSINSTWLPIRTLSLTGFGLGRIDTTLASSANLPVFWAWFYSVLVSPNYSLILPPNRECSGIQCASYYFPGSLAKVTLDTPVGLPKNPAAFIVKNSTGYQIDFSPVDEFSDLNNAICEVYGSESESKSAAVLVCLKKSGTDLLAGEPITARILTIV